MGVFGTEQKNNTTPYVHALQMSTNFLNSIKLLAARPGFARVQCWYYIIHVVYKQTFLLNYSIW
jgi:hypothetical protein